MFIGWAIVPLQAAIFTTGVVTRNRDTLMVAANGLLTPPEQVVQLDSRFLHTSYGVSWLDQKLPGYTTSEYALLPFMPLQNNSDMLPTETWTAETQMYWTNLTCKPAVNYTRLPTITEFRFDDGDGCVTQFSLGSATNNTFARFLSYVQFWGDANVNIALQNPNCTVERNQHKFLALFGQAEINPFVDGRGEAFYTELTALFCQPTYSMRTVTATVNASSAAVFNVEYDESVPATTVTDDTFNITHYEYLIGTNVIPISYEQTGNVHQTAKVEQVPRLTEQNITFGRAPMTGYGLAASKVDVKLLNDPVNLHQAFDSAHKLLFATFLNQIMVPKVKLAARPPPSEPFIGLRTDRPGSIEFVRAFSIVVEACLGVIAVLTIMLWMFYRKRWNQISSDPGSISDVMKLIRSSQRLLREFDDNGTVTEKALEENLWGHKYRLATLYKNGQPEMQLESTVTIEKLTPKKSPIDCPDQFNTVRPIELTYWCAAVWVTVISAAVAVLTQFYVRSVRENGKASVSCCGVFH